MQNCVKHIVSIALDIFHLQQILDIYGHYEKNHSVTLNTNEMLSGVPVWAAVQQDVNVGGVFDTCDRQHVKQEHRVGGFKVWRPIATVYRWLIWIHWTSDKLKETSKEQDKCR